jgi:hypothetical protein
MMSERLFNGEHNLRVRSRKTIFELEPGLDAGRAGPGAEQAITPSGNACSKTANDLAGHAGRHFKTAARPRQDHGKTTECHALAKYQGIAGLTLVSASITFMNWSQPGEWHRGTSQKPIHKSK